MDSDQGSEMETKFLWYQASSENPWLSLVVANERLLIEIQMRFVTCIIRERQLRLFGHVAHFPDANPAHQILSAREPHGCSRLIGISRRRGWARHLPGGRPDGGPWSTGGKWMQ